MSFRVPYSFVDALHKGTYDEYSVFHTPQHREDGDVCAEEDEPSAAVQEYISFRFDQDPGVTLVGGAEHHLGGFHF